MTHTENRHGETHLQQTVGDVNSGPVAGDSEQPVKWIIALAPIQTWSCRVHDGRSCTIGQRELDSTPSRQMSHYHGQSSFSPRNLLLLVTFVALSIASLRYPSRLCASVMFTLALVFLLSSILGIVYGRDRGRAFWTGFAVFGWCYLVVVFGPWFDRYVGPRLLSTHGIAYLQTVMSDQTATIWDSGNSTVFRSAEYGPMLIWDASSGRPLARVNGVYFQQIGHCVTVVLIGVIGGGLACCFHAKYGKPQANHLSSSSK